jgi:hypothetical protein
MKIIQSFWSGNRGTLLNNNFGWLSPEYHIMSWSLSSNLLAKFYEVELYTDKIGYDLLIDKLKLPYSKVHIVMDDLNKYDNNLWALPKIYAYSLQNEPFLHIDGDVFIWEKFSDKLMAGNLIAQNLESATNYYEKIMIELENELSYFPSEILQDRKESNSIYAYNAGIFGGYNVDFYKNYTSKSFEFVDKNLKNLTNINITNFNIFFEQYLFYCLSKGEKVECYFNEIIEDNGYKGFGNFEDVPFKKSFLHLLGVYKRDSFTCKKMSQKLLSEFPQAYINVLNLFNSKTAVIYSSSIQVVKNNCMETRQIGLNSKKNIFKKFNDYFEQNSLTNQYPKIRKNLIKFFNYDNNKIQSIFNSKKSIESQINYINDKGLLNLFEYEGKVNNYLKSLNGVNLKELATRDIELEFKFKKLFSEKNNDLKEQFRIIKEKYSTIIESPLLISDNLSLFDKDEISNNFSRMIIPEIQAPYYSEIILDELDEILVTELEESKTIKKLFRIIENYFDEDDLESSRVEFNKLIYGKLKRLIYQKCIIFSEI